MQGKFLLFFLYMNYYDFILIKWNLLMWLRTRRTDTILASDGPFLVQPKFHVGLEMKFHQKPNTKRGQSAQYKKGPVSPIQLGGLGHDGAFTSNSFRFKII